MKDTDYAKIIELTYVGNGFIPENQNGRDLAERCAMGEVVSFAEVTDRDLRFHRAYMALLAYIYSFMPKSFQNVIPKDKFYIFIKSYKKEYDVVFTFEDGTQAIEYQSIAFGRMSQKSFEEYVREQLPWIYANLVGAYYSGDMYDSVIFQIEQKFEKFLSKL